MHAGALRFLALSKIFCDNIIRLTYPHSHYSPKIRVISDYSMSHTCRSLILHCMDFRFGSAIKKHLEENGLLDNCDIVSLAGAAKNLVSPTNDAERELVLRQIEISKRLHHISEVILLNHTDCGAYGGRGVFTDRAAEDAKHISDLAEAKRIVLEKFPGLAIKTLIAQMEPDGVIHIQGGQ